MKESRNFYLSLQEEIYDDLKKGLGLLCEQVKKQGKKKYESKKSKLGHLWNGLDHLKINMDENPA